MDRIAVKLSHRHDLAGPEAKAGLERLVAGIAARFPKYGFRHQWLDGDRIRVTFTFERPGKGSGGGSAELVPGGVVVDFRADYRLPFFVPVALAEKKVRDELREALERAFGG